jgi:hypothetical protein
MFKAASPLRVFVLFFSTATLLASCGEIALNRGGAPESSAPIQSSFGQFPDIPTPPGAQVDVEKTLVLGGGENWIGQLVILNSQEVYGSFDFFKQKMSEYGWREIASVRAAVSVLTFSRQKRVATLQISQDRLMGSRITITVSPQGMSQGGMTAAP